MQTSLSLSLRMFSSAGQFFNLIKVKIMQTHAVNSKENLQKLGAYLFHFGLLTGLATLTFGLASCGGGGGESASTPAISNPTIFSITAIPAASGATGIIAASAAQPLTIYGTNFASGTSITISNGSTIYAVTASAVPSSTKITATVLIPSVPPDSYVTVTLQPPSGSAVSGILGVAQAYKTITADIQPIFDSFCISCHGSSGGLDLRSTIINGNMTSVINLISTNSIGCSQKFRVIAGDPRRASNVLIDLIRAKNTTAVLECNNSRPVNNNVMPPFNTVTTFSNADIQAIVDWIALGAN